MTDIPMASNKLGKARVISINMVNTASIFPPKYPETRPRISPINIDPVAAHILIKREIRAPDKIRLKISLPLLSVPQGCFQLGGNLMLSRSMDVGLKG